VFFFFRFLRNSQHPALKWSILALLSAFGVGLIVWGIFGHSTYLVIRGVIELVIVGVIFLRLGWRRNTPTGGGPNRPL
jgi:predicted Co/Zn/Cd cation transporter (cation efflux family)